MCLRILSCLLSALILSSTLSGSVAFAGDLEEERLLIVSKDAKTQAVKGHTEILITKKEALYHWHERRTLKNGGADTIEILFEKDTLMPVTYDRVISNKDRKTLVNVRVEIDRILVDVNDSREGMKEQSLPLPKGEFVIEPFAKQHLANQVGKGLDSGSFRMVVFVGNKFLSFDINWKSLGREKVTTAAGTFDCMKIKTEPSSWMIRAVVPTSSNWFDLSGTNKVVRSQGKHKRFTDEEIIDLVGYDLITSKKKH